VRKGGLVEAMGLKRLGYKRSVNSRSLCGEEKGDWEREGNGSSSEVEEGGGGGGH